MQWQVIRITNITPDEYAAIYAALSDSRRAHIDRMRVEVNRHRSLAATALAARVSGVAISAIETDDAGRPSIAGDARHISISHSGDTVAVAVGDEPVGIDIEEMRPVEEKLIHYVCTPAERDYVCAATGDERTRRFFSVWTAKEALFKRDGGSLRAIDTLAAKKRVATVLDGCFVTVV